MASEICLSRSRRSGFAIVFLQLIVLISVLTTAFRLSKHQTTKFHSSHPLFVIVSRTPITYKPIEIVISQGDPIQVLVDSSNPEALKQFEVLSNKSQQLKRVVDAIEESESGIVNDADDNLLSIVQFYESHRKAQKIPVTVGRPRAKRSHANIQAYRNFGSERKPFYVKTLFAPTKKTELGLEQKKDLKENLAAFSDLNKLMKVEEAVVRAKEIPLQLAKSFPKQTSNRAWQNYIVHTNNANMTSLKHAIIEYTNLYCIGDIGSKKEGGQYIRKPGVTGTIAPSSKNPTLFPFTPERQKILHPFPAFQQIPFNNRWAPSHPAIPSFLIMLAQGGMMIDKWNDPPTRENVHAGELDLTARDAVYVGKYCAPGRSYDEDIQWPHSGMVYGRWKFPGYNPDHPPTIDPVECRLDVSSEERLALSTWSAPGEFAGVNIYKPVLSHTQRKEMKEEEQLRKQRVQPIVDHIDATNPTRQKEIATEDAMRKRVERKLGLVRLFLESRYKFGDAPDVYSLANITSFDEEIEANMELLYRVNYYMQELEDEKLESDEVELEVVVPDEEDEEGHRREHAMAKRRAWSSNSFTSQSDEEVLNSKINRRKKKDEKRHLPTTEELIISYAREAERELRTGVEDPDKEFEDALYKIMNPGPDIPLINHKLAILQQWHEQLSAFALIGSENKIEEQSEKQQPTLSVKAIKLRQLVDLSLNTVNVSVVEYHELEKIVMDLADTVDSIGTPTTLQSALDDEAVNGRVMQRWIGEPLDYHLGRSTDHLDDDDRTMNHPDRVMYNEMKNLYWTQERRAESNRRAALGDPISNRDKMIDILNHFNEEELLAADHEWLRDNLDPAPKGSKKYTSFIPEHSADELEGVSPTPRGVTGSPDLTVEDEIDVVGEDDDDDLALDDDGMSLDNLRDLSDGLDD